MEVLDQLGIALGLASLAGINLYLTVLLAGACVKFGWIDLAAQHEGLAILGHPAVMIAAGVLFAVEFFADKVPWGDSVWDIVHTVIRPAGAILVSMQALGDADASMQVVAALMAGGASLTTHAAKAGARVAINHSPEPVSNIAASLTEDAGVVGGVALVAISPIVALAVFSVLLIVLWFVMPRLTRRLRSSWWLMLKNRSPFEDASSLPLELTSDQDVALAKARPDSAVPTWALPCAIGSARGYGKLRPHMIGALVFVEGGGTVAHFIGKKFWRPFVQKLDLSGCEVRRESKFLSEAVVAYTRSGDRLAVFRLPKTRSKMADSLATELRRLIAKAGGPEEIAENPRIEAADRSRGVALPA